MRSATGREWRFALRRVHSSSQVGGSDAEALPNSVSQRVARVCVQADDAAGGDRRQAVARQGARVLVGGHHVEAETARYQTASKSAAPELRKAIFGSSACPARRIQAPIRML